MTSSVFVTSPAEASGRAMTNSISSGSFDGVGRPASFRSIMLLQAQPRGLGQALGDRQQPCLAIAMPARVGRRWISGRD